MIPVKKKSFPKVIDVESKHTGKNAQERFNITYFVLSKVVFESTAQIAQCSHCLVVLCGMLCQASPKPPKLFPESDAFEVDYFLQCATCEKRKLEALS